MGFKSRRRSRSKRRKGHKAKRRRKSINRRVSNTSKKVVYVSPGHILADRLMTKLKWRDQFTVTGAITTSHYFKLRVNSPREPSVGAATHQPYGWDQFMLNYVNWRCYAVSYEFVVTNLSVFPGEISVRVENGTGTSPSVWRENLEYPGTQYKQIGADGSSNNTVRIRGKNNLHTLFGVSKSAYDGDTRTAGSAGSNPVEEMELVFGYNNLFAANNLLITCNLWFTTAFFDPFPQVPS